MKGADMPENEWHLDKRVPIALILTLLAQIAGFAWVASAMWSSIDTNRRDIDRVQVSINAIRENANIQAVQLGRIEENTARMRDDVSRLLRMFEGSRP